jgi:hypothetical protein
MDTPYSTDKPIDVKLNAPRMSSPVRTNSSFTGIHTNIHHTTDDRDIAFRHQVEKRPMNEQRTRLAKEGCAGECHLCGGLSGRAIL